MREGRAVLWRVRPPLGCGRGPFWVGYGRSGWARAALWRVRPPLGCGRGPFWVGYGRSGWARAALWRVRPPLGCGQGRFWGWATAVGGGRGRFRGPGHGRWGRARSLSGAGPRPLGAGEVAFWGRATAVGGGRGRFLGPQHGVVGARDAALAPPQMVRARCALAPLGGGCEAPPMLRRRGLRCHEEGASDDTKRAIVADWEIGSVSAYGPVWLVREKPIAWTFSENPHNAHLVRVVFAP